ncbi:lutropin-choriogonadotropic hormone receptor-like isoform X2 [Pectinophora gossypiella]|nr:lutropin-choriogonadotropic hormone receptor-like isoform X2 [Pectinophora gossypiella]
MITTSGLLEVPNLSHVQDFIKSSQSYLQAVDLEGNHIRRIPRHALRIRAIQVSLNLNLIEEVPAHTFKNAQIAKLSFRGNTKLRHLDEKAFEGNLFLKQLDLSNTAITSLPTSGLDKLEVLKLDKTPSLKYIPSIYEFQNLQKAILTHHFHCCAFAFPEIHDPERHASYQARASLMQKQCEDEKRLMAQYTKKRKERSLQPIRAIGIGTRRNLEDDTDLEDTATTVEDSSESEEYLDLEMAEDEGMWHANGPVDDAAHGLALPENCSTFSIRNKVECTPVPNALNPCEDVMGWSWLRASVWFVITAAVVGNVAVLLVLLTNHAEMTVPRFLMCHLAFSDLCTGIYLFMLAVIDLRSFGEFFNYAYDWQYGVGCKIAGFLSVFSGQLSVFTLTIVTVERWFAITYAIYLERRINLATAAKIMVSGWLFAILLAGLPLVGVSDYSSTSICLPVESENVGDVVYQGSLFMTNAVAWVLIVVCYVQIYRSLGGGGEKYGGRGAAAAAERRIANKMALLIGTDLLCWAPVAFFGVTALAGAPLVDVSHGKVLLVFFYPLNACANPFLYAILTKQYRRDLITLIARSGRCNWLVARYKMAATPPPTAHTNPSAPPLLPLVERQRSQTSDKENGEAVL